MAYVSFSLAVQVRRWPSARIRLHGYVRPVVPDLLEECTYSIVRGVRLQHESLVWVHQ